MDDLISRRAALDCFHDWIDKHGNVYCADESEEYQRIEALPSALQWTPCSEQLPENRLYVLVTYKHVYGLIDHGITWYGYAEKKWDTSREVSAWMPLPEPWRGEEHETD